MASESEFLDALRKRFPPAEYALLPQVRNQTGFGGRVRTADALAVSLWPSRGIDVTGFEFKDSRTDWLKELKDGSKSEAIGRWCSYWWLVVSGPTVVQPGELPPQWGLLLLTDGGTRVATKAPRRTAEPPTWEFVAAVLRAAAKTHPDEEVRKAEEAAFARGRAEGYAAGKEYGGRHSDEAFTRLKKQVIAFETASGVRLDPYDEWRSRKIGEAVRFVMSGGLGDVGSYPDRLRHLADAVQKVADELKGVGVG